MVQYLIPTIVACLALGSTIRAKPFHQDESSNNADFDLFVYAQVWMFAICRVANFEQPGSCIVPEGVNNWTVHGLWPSSLTQHLEPHDCDKSDPFVESKVASIRERLEHQWPNVFVSESITSLWEHEWSKHGTCAKDVEATDGELKYFSTSLDFLQKFPINKYLQESGIEQSNDKTYTLSAITEAIHKVTKTKIQPHCNHINERGQDTYYLADIRICVDKSLTLIDCEGDDPKKINRFLDLHAKPQNGSKGPHGDPTPPVEACPSDKPIYYIPAN